MIGKMRILGAAFLAALTLPLGQAAAQEKDFVFYGVSFEQLEFREGIDDSGEVLAWDGDAFVGNDEWKLRLISEGEYATDEDVFVTIADDGPGIPADQVSRVTEPYYTTKKTGSGLGLMIVHRIVNDHGGELEFKSREGIGTEVTVFLPRAEKLVRFLPQKSEAERNVIDVDVTT